MSIPDAGKPATEKALARQTALNRALIRWSWFLTRERPEIDSFTRMILTEVKNLTGSRHGFFSPDDQPAQGIPERVPVSRKAFFLNSLPPRADRYSPPGGRLLQDNILMVPVRFQKMIVGRVIMADKAGDYNEDDLHSAGGLAQLYALAAAERVSRIIHEVRKLARRSDLEDGEPINGPVIEKTGEGSEFSNPAP